MDLVSACHPLLFSHCSPDTFTVTGTIICPVNDKVSLCIQQDSSGFPLILLDLPIHTSKFASFIERGISRIVFECHRETGESPRPLLSVTKWVMNCNGQKMGLAMRREVTRKETVLLEMMRTVTAGAGVLPDKGGLGSGGCKYLRGQFERAVGSTDSEAYHLMDPSDCLGQELSIFFLRI
ncbi:hypothetical protein L1049_024784 [Liquidambar formosana]|uniref:Protein MIZU-KUSSEI 1-like n=1 Tax=Liquidambar formosana TaxID=63359 RepID=A0AAP0S222_LIQFO